MRAFWYENKLFFYFLALRKKAAPNKKSQNSQPAMIFSFRLILKQDKTISRYKLRW
jgi:hypothetical protein